jgi:Metallo-beta-lactamase superfamily
VSAAPEAVADGLWRWTIRHPEWHPRTEFGAEVACWAVRRANAGTLLIDPLVEDESDLDDLVEGEVTIVVTIPYHVRSAAELARRHGATVHGHADVRRRLPGDVSFAAIEPGAAFAGGLTGTKIGSPPRKELPLHVPDASALALGDAIVGAEGGLRVWVQQPMNAKRERWYRERLVPSLEPLLSPGAERVLTTHGPPVLRDGAAALREALAAPAWYHRPS